MSVEIGGGQRDGLPLNGNWLQRPHLPPAPSFARGTRFAATH